MPYRDALVHRSLMTTTSSAERSQADAASNQARKRGVKVLVSAAALGVALTIGSAVPAAAVAPAPAVHIGAAASPTVEGCKGIYGQPLAPILCTSPQNYQPLPRSNGGTPWGALRGCVTNYQAAKGALEAALAVYPQSRSFLVLYTAGYCLYSLGSGG